MLSRFCLLQVWLGALLLVKEDTASIREQAALADQAPQLAGQNFARLLGGKTRSRMSLSTAQAKFWRMPELIEKLLEYLDEFSILSIVGVNLLTVQVLQTASRTTEPLGKLIRKVLGFGLSQIFEHRGRSFRGCQTLCWPSWRAQSPFCWRSLMSSVPNTSM